MEDNTTQALTLIDAEIPAVMARREVVLGPAQLDLLNHTIAKDLSHDEMALFGEVCRRMQLDPFAKQIYAIKRQDRVTFQVGIDGFRALSERTGKYRGMRGPLWCAEDGEWRDVWLSAKPPVAAKVGILRSDFDEPVWAVARYAAYKVEKNALWTTMPETMIAKVAEALARRIAFPDALSGVYEPAEMEQANNPTPPATTTQDTARHDPAAYAKRTIEQGKEMAAKMAKATTTQAKPETLSYRQAVAGRETIKAEWGDIDIDETLPSWAAIRKDMLGVGVRTMADANALTMESCGLPWEQLREEDLDAKRKVIVKVHAMVLAKRAAEAKIVEAGNGVDLADLPPVAMVP